MYQFLNLCNYFPPEPITTRADNNNDPSPAVSEVHQRTASADLLLLLLKLLITSWPAFFPFNDLLIGNQNLVLH